MRIGITMGDPNGVGPEIVARLLQKYRDCVVYGNAAALSAYARLNNQVIDPYGRLPEHSRGRVSAACGAAAYAYVEAAARDALAGKIDALVTAPLNKAALRLAGYAYAGHTEMLAEFTGAKKFGMFFYAPDLCVMLTTVHRSLKQVPALLTRQKLRDTVDLALLGLRLIGRANPRLAVCGLNPHAGEGGLFGLEEKKIIAPVIRDFQRKGLNIAGPFPADTLFVKRRQYDLIVAHYHDQGLIPMKMRAFDRAVNVTVGLPIIRTSADHGTAYDIAGQGLASCGSLAAAVRLARTMVKNRAG